MKSKRAPVAKRFSWYHLLFASALVTPAVICQTVVPFLAFDTWEELAEIVYARLLSFQSPDTSSPSRVALIEIDQRTIDTLGWPIDHQRYVQLLEKLKASGQPWILSQLRLQALDKAEQTTAQRSERAAKDAALASAIKNYGRYVGSGLEYEAGSELSAQEEATLLPRVALNKEGEIATDFPWMPLNIVEADQFVEAQRAFGFALSFGASPTVHCTKDYMTDSGHTGAIVIPSSLAWVTAFANGVRFTTQSGASWPRKGEKTEFKPERTMTLGYMHCLTSPMVTTHAFMGQRHIERISFGDFLAPGRQYDLKDKVVILAGEDMHRFRGPGTQTEKDDGVVEEQLLTARFLDDLLTGHTIRREDMSKDKFMTWLPLAMAGLLFAVSLAFGLGAVIAAAASVFAVLVAVAVFNLARGDFLMPLESMCSVAGSGVALSALFVGLRYQMMRREIRLAENLRKALAQANTLAEVESATSALWSEEFAGGKLHFDDFDRQLYEAVNDPKGLIQVIEGRQQSSVCDFVARPAATAAASMTGGHKIPLTLRNAPFNDRQATMRLPVDSAVGLLGTITISCVYRSHEEAAVTRLVQILKIEIGEHWHRIKLLVDQKLMDYKFLAEQTRVDILERFLTKVLVGRFSDNATMEENLRRVLTPRTTKAALMQADIRGYSKVSAHMEPLEMVTLLQGYFRNVVDAAQNVAQVKLIGDCIFLFIEEDAAHDGATPTDLALELAAILVRETRAQNARRAETGGEPLNFGIAIHYGEVVVGNLSSDSCIDYTVISPNVNLVARLEEITKNEKLAANLGRNGVILSHAAAENLSKHRATPRRTLVLADYGVTVRSFSDVCDVIGISADDAEKLRDSAAATDLAATGIKSKAA